MWPPSIAEQAERPYISTGHLPDPEMVQELVSQAHLRFKSNSEGTNSQVYPALARVPSELFGICVAGASGRIYGAGDIEYEFSIMSVSKPFVFALVCEAIGPEEARARLGANATGLPFNSLAAIEHGAGRTNPMVNAGAIATTSLVPGASAEERWRLIHDGLSRFAGRKLPLNEEVYASASKTNFRNRSIARLLESYDRIYCDAKQATDLYTRQCSLNVSARDLAVMGATLADGGVNPVTRQRVVDAAVCHYALAVMVTAGLYETSGDWLYDIGLPGKSGIGGGIVAVSPGKGGFGTFAPPLDAAGNSVRGQLAAKFLSQRLGMDLFVSQPDE
ncbi:glutaminase A [Bradyrhizobium septentrionale]|uniref:Glutaminase n=2 Tax=Bradyrhizobium septentrionale TaxID=1404411 RepID=A0A974A323_9BRAD|nr:glutaminase A [Bradyrhizobium septentrionale]UGY15366.1 glutaminase A [Bradyrhizobium septentrionale]UGY23949.1 glutaminase A [Bradyrhizobium septentrionale]